MQCSGWGFAEGRGGLRGFRFELVKDSLRTGLQRGLPIRRRGRILGRLAGCVVWRQECRRDRDGGEESRALADCVETFLFFLHLVRQATERNPQRVSSRCHEILVDRRGTGSSVPGV